jgi:hypothetical protein
MKAACGPQREASVAQIAQIWRILSALDFPMSDPMRLEACRFRGSERSACTIVRFTFGAHAAGDANCRNPKITRRQS